MLGSYMKLTIVERLDVTISSRIFFLFFVKHIIWA